ncbi:hypothetical protein CPLU01_11726 [Colletotrichum plurivorum]|uniref:Uncharacterized protein n=1 Tax=Colletotrichum plurivorum TaxID=2175906 RepID=A0A8H6N830_9PEZI|nr:hypothetical protein CPLU01_11726 [Colletotrichum plurivorum]
MSADLTPVVAFPVALAVGNGTCPSRDFEPILEDLILALNGTLKLWECLVMGLLALDLAVTIYGLGSEVPGAVLPEAEDVVVAAFTELVLLLQLLQILLPAYPAAEFEALSASKRIREESAVCRWIGGMFGTQMAEIELLATPKLGEGEMRAFGVFLVPVAAAVVWKWRRLRIALREVRRRDEETMVARAFLAWERWMGED